MDYKPEYVRTIDASGFRKKRGGFQALHIDGLLLFLILLLTGLGLTILYSASDEPWEAIRRQGSFIAMGYLLMIVVAQLPMRFYQRSAPFLYLLGVVLLILVPFFGTGAKGAQRWLAVPGLPRFQPSELLKLVMPLVVAWYLSARILPPKFKYIAMVLLIVAIPTGLIASQPDLGTSILIASSGLSVLFFAGLPWRYMFGAVGLLFASAWPMWNFVLHDYQKGRILTLLNPERDKFGAGWNILQSKTAIGSGGLDGKGWLNGTQSQLNFLPESHTDFIIAVLAEEWGFIGVLSLLALYVAIVGRSMVISWQAGTTFNKLVAGSITLTFFVYTFVNMGMVSGLLPVVGVPLPLVSQGGTAFISLMIGFGLLMAVATDNQGFNRY